MEPAKSAGSDAAFVLATGLDLVLALVLAPEPALVHALAGCCETSPVCEWSLVEVLDTTFEQTQHVLVASHALARKSSSESRASMWGSQFVGRIAAPKVERTADRGFSTLVIRPLCLKNLARQSCF